MSIYPAFNEILKFRANFNSKQCHIDSDVDLKCTTVFPLIGFSKLKMMVRLSLWDWTHQKYDFGESDLHNSDGLVSIKIRQIKKNIKCQQKHHLRSVSQLNVNNKYSERQKYLLAYWVKYYNNQLSISEIWDKLSIGLFSQVIKLYFDNLLWINNVYVIPWKYLLLEEVLLVSCGN